MSDAALRAAFLTTLLTLPACLQSSYEGEPTSTAGVTPGAVFESEYGRVELQPETRLPESMAGYESAEVNGDAVILTFEDAASAAAADLSAQDVVVGTASDGYLRRAERVTVSGREVRIETSAAVLSDALLQADFTIEASLDGEWEVVAADGDPAPPPDGVVTANVGALDFGTVNLMEGSDSTGTASIDLQNLQLELTPTFRWTERIVDGEEELADVQLFVDASTTSNLVLSASDAVSWSGSKEIKQLKRRQLVLIGYMPVVLTHSLTFTGTAGLDAEASGEFSMPMIGLGNVTAQAQHNADAWDFDHSASFALQPGDPAVDLDAQVTLRAGLAIKLASNAYGVAGAYGTVEPYLSGTACTPGGWSIDAGADAEVGIELLWLEDDEQEKDFWDWSSPTTSLANDYLPDHYADTDGDGFGDEEAPFDRCDTDIDWIYVDRSEAVYDCDDGDDEKHPDVSPEIAECEAGRDLNCDETIELPLAMSWQHSSSGTRRATAADLCSDGGSGVNTAWVVNTSGTWTTFSAPPSGASYEVTGTLEVLYDSTSSVVCRLADGSTQTVGWECSGDCVWVSSSRCSCETEFTWYGSTDECATATHTYDAGDYGTGTLTMDLDWF